MALSVAFSLPPGGRAVHADDAQSESSATRPNERIKHRDTYQPALIRADQMITDRDLSTVTASGHVEIDQGGRILLADAVSYNFKQDVIIATGNVSLTDPDGEVRFADYIELSGDMKQAVARHLRH